MKHWRKWLTLLLVLLNLGFAAWVKGYLRPLGWQPADPREPQRLQQQLRPEALQLSPPDQRQ